MSLPDWMPPLPTIDRAGKEDDLPRMCNVHWFIESEHGWIGAFRKGAMDGVLHDYGLRCVEAYKASLKPSFYVRTFNGEVDWSGDCFSEDIDQLQLDCFDEEDNVWFIKLYRID